MIVPAAPVNKEHYVMVTSNELMDYTMTTHLRKRFVLHRDAALMVVSYIPAYQHNISNIHIKPPAKVVHTWNSFMDG